MQLLQLNKTQAKTIGMAFVRALVLVDWRFQADVAPDEAVFQSIDSGGDLCFESYMNNVTDNVRSPATIIG